MLNFAMTFRYIPTGRRGINSVFRAEGAILHTLVKRTNVSNPPIASGLLRYEPRDVSFFLSEPVDESALLHAIARHPHVVPGTPTITDRFTHPVQGKQSMTIRFAIEGFLSPTDANNVQVSVGKSLCASFHVQVR
jgi:hypothetical protein